MARLRLSTGASKQHRIGGFSRTPDRRIPGCWSLRFCACRNFWRPHQSGSTNLRGDTDIKWFSGRLLKYGQQLSKTPRASQSTWVQVASAVRRFFALHSEIISLFSEGWSAAYSQRSLSSLGSEDACVCADLPQFR